MSVGTADRVWDDEPLLRIQAELFLDVRDLLVAERLPVDRARVLLARAKADRRLDDDQGRCSGVLTRLLQSCRDVRDLLGGVVFQFGPTSADDVPASRLEAERDVLGEAVVDRSVDGDLPSFAVSVCPPMGTA